MRSEIRNIRYLAKYGAFGNPDAMGFYIYGKRRDGRTVPCKSEVQADGGIQIYSSYAGTGEFAQQDLTEFSLEEWSRVRSGGDSLGARFCNEILDARNVEQARAPT